MSKENGWLVFVPTYSKEGKEFAIEHHRAFDRFVRERTGGLTLLRSAKGEWINPTGKLYREGMIPVIIVGKRSHIIEILDFIKTHYDQEAALALRIADEVLLK